MVRILKRPLAASAGLNFLDPALTENSARRQVVDEMAVDVAGDDGSCGENACSSDGGFFFDVTCVHSDISCFRFNLIENLRT